METTARLAGRYQLVREIGSGGMGRVFQAIDTETGRAVAAKILIAGSQADLRSLLRFQSEGTVLRALQHPNIVHVHGTYLDEQVSCIIMELIEGRSLAAVLRSERLPLARIKLLAGQVAAALAYAHGRGIIHRDIKPANIMVDANDHVTVTDFGVARILQEEAALLSKSVETLGTPLYMSPEQVEGQQVDGRADIYALGIVLYEMATGRTPFEGNDPLTIAFKHVHKAPPPPRSINATLPSDWERIILKALEKDPARRFQTARDMEAAIGALSIGANEAWAQQVQPPISVTQVAAPAWDDAWRGPSAPPQHPANAYGNADGRTWMPANGGMAPRTPPPETVGGSVPTAFGPPPHGFGALPTATMPDPKRGMSRGGRTAAALAAVLVVGSGLGLGVYRIGFASPHPSPTPHVTPTSTPVATVRPGQGSLYHHANGKIDDHYAKVRLRNFDARVRFTNPYGGSAHSWDYGFEFRDTGQDRQYRLALRSDGEWYLFYGTAGTYQAHGKLRNFRTSAGQHNEVRLIVDGADGLLYVNGTYEGQFNVSAHTASGRIAVATGIIDGDEIKGKVTRYAGFSVGRLAPTARMASGELRGDTQYTVKHVDAGVKVRDFIAAARFQNPADAAGHAWDYGIEFRDTGGNDQYRVVLDSSGGWNLFYGAGSSLASGKVGNLHTGANAFNEVRVVVVGGRAELFVNGRLAGTFDVSGRVVGGDVTVAAGLYRGDLGAGGIVRFENFTVWSLD